MVISVAIGVALVWLLALGVLLLNLRSLGKISPLPVERADESLPSLAVVIPARNEERDIERCVRSLASQDYPSLEVIVIDDQSMDGTSGILARVAGEMPRLKVIDGDEPPSGWLGKPWALQQGGEVASSELLLFCDADVVYEPGALRRIVRELIERGVDGLTVLPRMEMRGFWEHVLMVQLPFTALTLIPIFLSRSLRSPWLAIGGGPGNLLWRETWIGLGTHESLKQAVIDDVALMRLIRHEGGETAVIRGSDLVSVRMYHGFREIFAGFSKNSYHAMGGSVARASASLALLAIIQLFPFLLLGHAVTSSLTGRAVTLAHWIGLVTCLEIVVARVILFVKLDYRLDNAILGHPLMVLGWLTIMGWSIWKVGVRRQLQWRGRGYDARAARFGR